ncbi:hypothetical protein NMG60_11000340 [Bertholletia excelsa]
MDNLLCDEVLGQDQAPIKSRRQSLSGFFHITEEDWRQAFKVCLKKEFGYMPQPGHLDRLRSCGLVLARFKAIQWLIKSRSRLNLSFHTIFNAANYLDRFLSTNLCKGWKRWKIELLAVACLSVASKFGETDPPLLHEIQMEDRDCSFQSSMIQRMELTLLEALGWRLGSVTSHSYVELLTWDISSPYSNMPGDLSARVTELLLCTLFDCGFMEFRQSVVAISALRCIIEEWLPSAYEGDYLAYITRLIPEDQKVDLIKCQKIMRENLVHPYHILIAQRQYLCCCPSSPVTVLTMEEIDLEDSQEGFSLFKIPSFNINPNLRKPKRKREEC